MSPKIKREDVLKYDPFNPYCDNDGNTLTKPLYFPKYHKTRFKFRKEELLTILDIVDSGEYHTVGKVKGEDGKMSEHAFLVLQILPTDIPDEFIVVSEDYGMVQ